jgi:hypothetical protein
MSEENLDLARRAFAFFVKVGAFESEEIVDKMPDSAMEELFDPEFELVPSAQGLLTSLFALG